MLQLAYFKFSEAEKMNELLKNYRLAPGASIMVSNGEIIIPFEDGAPATKEQQKVRILEMKNQTMDEMFVIEHSNEVLDYLIVQGKNNKDEITADLEELKKSPNKKASYEKEKKLKEHLKFAEEAIAQAEQTKNNNQKELVRLSANLERFDEKVMALEEGRA